MQEHSLTYSIGITVILLWLVGMQLLGTWRAYVATVCSMVADGERTDPPSRADFLRNFRRWLLFLLAFLAISIVPPWFCHLSGEPIIYGLLPFAVIMGAPSLLSLVARLRSR